MHEIFRNTQIELQEIKKKIQCMEVENNCMRLCSLDTTKEFVNLKIKQLKLSISKAKAIYDLILSYILKL